MTGIRILKYKDACPTIVDHPAALLNTPASLYVWDDDHRGPTDLRPSVLPAPYDWEQLFAAAANPVSIDRSSGRSIIARLDDVLVDLTTHLVYDANRVLLGGIIGDDPLADIDPNLHVFQQFSPICSTDAYIVDLVRNKTGMTQTSVVLAPRMFQPEGRIDRPVIYVAPDSNYFHWIESKLPQILHVHQLLGGDVGILLYNSPPRFVLDSLRYFGIAESNLIISGVQRVACRSLLAPTPLAPKCRVGSRNVALLTASLPAASDGDGNRPKVIYVSRRDAGARRVANEAEVLAALEPFGVIPVIPGDLSFAQQVATFADAAVVIGPQGAGLANVMFSRRAHVVELTQYHWDPSIWNICAAKGLAHTVVIADAEIRVRDNSILRLQNDGRDCHPAMMFFDPALVVQAVTRALAGG